MTNLHHLKKTQTPKFNNIKLRGLVSIILHFILWHNFINSQNLLIIFGTERSHSILNWLFKLLKWLMCSFHNNRMRHSTAYAALRTEKLNLLNKQCFYQRVCSVTSYTYVFEELQSIGLDTGPRSLPLVCCPVDNTLVEVSPETCCSHRNRIHVNRKLNKRW